MLPLYKNIKEIRISLGMSQDELAEKTGYTSRSSIAKIEKGEVDLAQSKIEAFAKALNVPPQVLMGWDKPSSQAEPQTIAAHFDGEEYSENELEEIKKFAEFVKSRRN